MADSNRTPTFGERASSMFNQLGETYVIHSLMVAARQLLSNTHGEVIEAARDAIDIALDQCDAVTTRLDTPGGKYNQDAASQATATLLELENQLRYAIAVLSAARNYGKPGDPCVDAMNVAHVARDRSRHLRRSLTTLGASIDRLPRAA
jgi:hypothetical protein